MEIEETLGLNSPNIGMFKLVLYPLTKMECQSTENGVNSGYNQPKRDVNLPLNYGHDPFPIPCDYASSQQFGRYLNRINRGGNVYPHSQSYLTRPDIFDSPPDFGLPPHSNPWSNVPFGLNQSDPRVEKVICRGCRKPYKWPTTLDCMHVFCFNCICTKQDARNRSIVCILCDQVTPVVEGAYKLLLDFVLCKYMFKFKMAPFACTACTRGTDAVICCTSCPAYLCEFCQDGHCTMRIFSNHVLSPIAKVVRHNGDIEPMCEKHAGEPLIKYCVTCPEMICDKCMLEHNHDDSPGNQSNHELQEPFNDVISKLRGFTEEACVKHKEVVEMKKKIPEMKNNIDAKKRLTRRKVDDYTDYLKNVVDEHRRAAHQRIEKAAEEMEASLVKYNKLVAAIESELEAVANFNTFSVEEGTPSTIMTSLEFMENSYKNALGEYSVICSKNTADGLTFEIVFNPDYPRTSEFIQDNLTAVTYKINGQDCNLQHVTLRPDISMGISLGDYNPANNSDCNYARWSTATDAMPISTGNGGNNRKGAYVVKANCYRTRISPIHAFGDYGRADDAFTEPSGQAYIEDGSYIICDTNNHRIVYLSNDHVYIRYIGQPPNLPPLADYHENGKGGPRSKSFARQDGYLYFPNRVAICPKPKHIIATERPPSHDVQIFSVDGQFIRCFGGNVLQYPRGVTVDENAIIIVVECKVVKLTMFDHDGTQLASHSLAKDLEFPNDVSAKDGKIYISDDRGHCVKVFDYDAKFLQKIGSDNMTYFPIGVSINCFNQIVVTDNHNTFNITVFDLDGKVLSLLESITKHAQCHNVAVYPTKLELMLTTKDCNVYFFNFDPNAQHPPPAPTSRGSNHFCWLEELELALLMAILVLGLSERLCCLVRFFSSFYLKFASFYIEYFSVTADSFLV